MRAILALTLKDLHMLLRVRAGFFFTFVWPLLVAIFFGIMFSGSGSGSARISIGVVDLDDSPASREFIANLKKSDNLNVSQAGLEEATALVRQGKRTAAAVLPKGFGEAYARVFHGDPPRIELLIDPSRKAEIGMLEGLLFQQAAGNMQRLFSDRAAAGDMVRKALGEVRQLPDTDGEKAPLNRFLAELGQFVDRPQSPGTETAPSAAWKPLEVVTRETRREYFGPRNSFDLTFPQGILWGIIGCVMTFGIGMVTERTQGTMVRLQMSPLTRAHLLAGKALACFAAIFVVEAALFLLGRVAFHVRPASWALLALAGLATAIAFVGIMMLTAALGKTEQAAAGAGWSIMLPLAMLGGGMIPLFVMTSWMVVASHISPVKWAILAMEGAIWRGFSLQEMLLPCAILTAVGVVCFLIGIRTFRPAA
jgi:ABC-2 type transport system permease protein